MAFKVEYKLQPNQQWQTKLSGADETSAFSTYERLKNQYKFVRVLDKNGNVVVS